jgi:hypothetical protein
MDTLLKSKTNANEISSSKNENNVLYYFNNSVTADEFADLFKGYGYKTNFMEVAVLVNSSFYFINLRYYFKLI